MTTYALDEMFAGDIDTGSPDVVAELCSSVFVRPHLRTPQLAALRAHDAAHGSDYVATLAACLDSLGNVATSSERLGVHVNTFRYRLRRLVNVAGLDLDDPDQRLVCALELAAPPAPEASVAGTDRDAPEWRGLPAGVPVLVVAFRVLGDDDDSTCRLARMVALSWDAFRASAWCDVTGHTVYSVVAVGSSGSAEVAESTVRRVVREAESALNVRVVAGIGPVVPGVREAETSRRLADDVLRAVIARGGERVASLDDVRTTVVLDAFAAAAAEWPDLDGGVVSELAAHDATHGTAYVDTLRAYLDAFGDITVAASRTFVHVRTFRYRLRRIEAIGGIRLDDAPARLAVALQLRVNR